MKLDPTIVLAFGALASLFLLVAVALLSRISMRAAKLLELAERREAAQSATVRIIGEPRAKVDP